MISAETKVTPAVLVEAALYYHKRGWPLIPVAPNKKPCFDLFGDHAPVGSDAEIRGTRVRRVLSIVRKHPPTEDDIRSWFETHLDCAFAVVAGNPSGLVIVDFDGPIPEDFHIPTTPMLTTRRGVHVYFRRRGRFGSFDLRHDGRMVGHVKGDGGYAILPPSVHKTGHLYSWREGLSPEELNWEFAELPDWVMKNRPTLLTGRHGPWLILAAIAGALLLCALRR
jgi:hypothetical protein